MSNIIELIELKNITSINDIKPSRGYFKELDYQFLTKYIEENKEVIDCIDVGIAEDAGAMIEIWKNPFGYIKENKKMVIDSSPWGTPAVVVHFKDGDILTFSCYVKEKKIESKKKNVFQKIIFIFKYRKAVKNS